MKRVIIYIIYLIPFSGFGQSLFEGMKRTDHFKPTSQNGSNERIIHFCGHLSESMKSALYVIDGVIIDQSKINSINTDDIKEIIVLQSKEAVAIYGAQGINGLIVIYTKTATLKIFCGNYGNTVL